MSNTPPDAVIVDRLIQQMPRWLKQGGKGRVKYDRQGRAQLLNLSRLGLTALPPEIGALTHLGSLILSKNKLTSLPAELGQLSQLRWFEANENKLTHLPLSWGGSPLCNGFI